MKIAIIGAGISGCNLYFNLKEKYDDITIFDKSRGTGGRLSTKYIGDKFIDHGTPYLEPQSDELKDMCLYLSSQNILKARYDRFTPKNGANKMCSFLIDKKDLVKQAKITKASKTNSKWKLEDANCNVYEEFDMLFITIPTLQILEMEIDLNEDIRSSLASVNYDSRFNVILYSEDYIQLDEKLFEENENIEKVINNSKKYGYEDFSSYVIHCSNEYSTKLNSHTKEEIFEMLKLSLGVKENQLIKEFTAITHLWKYAFAKSTLDIPYYFDKETNLGICGDYFNLNNVEGSYLSSSMLADKFI